MTETQSRTRRGWLVVVFCLLGVVAVVLGVASRGGEEKAESLLPEELSVESLQAQATDPGQLREVLDQHNPSEMTEEQRRELRHNVRQVHRSMLDEHLAEYSAAAEQERQAILDKHIDEFQKRMAEWRKRQEEQGNREDQERPKWREMFGSRTREERKADSESRNPDDMARRMAYFTAVRERMAERGIEMPFGRRGMGGRGPGMGGRGRGPGW